MAMIGVMGAHLSKSTSGCGSAPSAARRPLILSGSARADLRRWLVRRQPGWICLAATLGLAGCASTPELTPAPEPPEEVNAFVACGRPAGRREILVDAASRRLHQTVCGAALWFDGLFGERDLDAALRSYGRLEVATSYSQFTGTKTRVRFDARVKLPALKDRLNAFVGLDDEDDFARDRSEGQGLRPPRRETDRDEFLAGLGFASVTTDRFQSEFRVGVRSPRQPKVFAQNRFSYLAYATERNRLLLRITPFWNNRDRLGVTTSTSFDHIVAEPFLLRWATAATITEVSPGLDWRSATVLYQNLRGSSAVAYEVFIRGASDAREPLHDYGVRTVYREPFFDASLFGQFVVGYSWPRTDPALKRDGAADVGLGVELPFGAKPK
jgi:hypothetical protein